MAKRRRYTAEDHRKAFEIYYEKRTYSAVSDEMQMAYTTPFRWCEKTYVCPFGCPWHGWENLLAERERAMHAKIKLLEQGNTNPLHHERAMVEAIESKVPTTVDAVKQIVRNDLERLTHWEMLYAKVFFDATGVALDFEQIKDPQLDPSSLYRMGLHVTNLEAAIRALQACQVEISKLRGQLDPTHQAKSHTDGSDEVISIGDLRNFRKRLESLPPDQIRVVAREIIVEGKTVKSTSLEETNANE